MSSCSSEDLTGVTMKHGVTAHTMMLMRRDPTRTTYLLSPKQASLLCLRCFKAITSLQITLFCVRNSSECVWCQSQPIDSDGIG